MGRQVLLNLWHSCGFFLPLSPLGRPIPQEHVFRMNNFSQKALLSVNQFPVSLLMQWTFLWLKLYRLWKQKLPKVSLLGHKVSWCSGLIVIYQMALQREGRNLNSVTSLVLSVLHCYWSLLVMNERKMTLCSSNL